MSDEQDDDDVFYRLTPKAWITEHLSTQYLISPEAAELFWYKLQEFATQRLNKETKSTAPYPALIFNGLGGEVQPVYFSICDETKEAGND